MSVKEGYEAAALIQSAGEQHLAYVLILNHSERICPSLLVRKGDKRDKKTLSAV